ncbi:hypothetical protein GCM10027055_00250 [Janibacter alkaliphilus]|uniref:Uncharacterized protein n=1 Tax=Janibacter alkaliphilus TaxID=1069963 RepID=A0A852X8K1_9MICO|nr:hypothetical protein [Janibacter alkaliphilus]NYG36644.1 hypothetical protein [Janibacter alkaliphilus]
MTIERQGYTRGDVSASEADESRRVAGLAAELQRQLELRSAEIDGAHLPGAQSRAIQDIVSLVLTREMEFREEVVLTKQDGIVTQARPDFVYRLSDGRGVMAEVERGGTVNNNHDLKDMWKAHIAPDIQHLILIVPNSNWKGDGAARERPYPRVCARVGAFFGHPRREVDVLSAHVLGYGPLTLDPSWSPASVVELPASRTDDPNSR